MTKDKMQNLLQNADRMAGPPGTVSVGLAGITRQHAHHRHRRKIVASLSVAAVIMLSVGIWQWTAGVGRINEQKRIAKMQADMQFLRAQADVTLKVVNELLERQRRQQRIAELRAKLAAIDDPLEKMNEEIETTAFTIVYFADKKLQRPGQKAAAIEDYKTVLRLYPQTRSAEKAKQRLAQLQDNSTIPKTLKGEML